MFRHLSLALCSLLLGACAHQKPMSERTPASGVAIVRDILDLRSLMGRSTIEVNDSLRLFKKKWKDQKATGITMAGTFESKYKPVYTLKIDNSYYETHGPILLAGVYIRGSKMKELVKPSHELETALKGLPVKRIHRDSIQLEDGSVWGGDEFTFELKDLTEQKLQRIIEALQKNEDEVFEIF